MRRLYKGGAEAAGAQPWPRPRLGAERGRCPPQSRRHRCCPRCTRRLRLLSWYPGEAGRRDVASEASLSQKRSPWRLVEPRDIAPSQPPQPPAQVLNGQGQKRFSGGCSASSSRESAQARRQESMCHPAKSTQHRHDVAEPVGWRWWWRCNLSRLFGLCDHLLSPLLGRCPRGIGMRSIQLTWTVAPFGTWRERLLETPKTRPPGAPLQRQGRSLQPR